MKTPGKNTEIIISFLLLSLIWNLECREMSGPSMNLVKKIEKCDSTEGHTIKVEKYRINRYNQTVYTYDGNIELQTELRDEDTEINIMVEKWGNGGWKRNFLRRIPNACSSAEKFAPNYVQSIMKQANITGCPIPAGHYEAKDLVVNVDVAYPIPYGLYRSQVDMFKNGTIIFCIRFILDIVPLD
uniref:MD-2-related lipid-recognition domain-containing protein n=1 Tax=Rhodnius prolixus TaxID=13249 RepID=T1HKU0_RHOPR